MIEKVDHISLVTKDLDKTVALLSRLFGFGVVDTSVVPEQGFRSAFIGKGDAFVELIEPLGPDTPIGRFLGTKETALHHFSLRVDSIDDESEALRSMGTRMISDTPLKAGEGVRTNFLHPSSTGGVLIELIERK
jgi:methylmalonyl-CoA/ethylmalonyl-CoA epimerase